MDDILKPLDRDLRTRFEFADAVELIGPEVLVSRQVRGKAARLAQALCLRKMAKGSSKLSLACLHGFLSDFALRDILNCAHEYGPPFDVLSKMARGVQIFHAASRGNNPE